MHAYDVRPYPTTHGIWGPDEKRWRQGELRWRMLRGLWMQDLESALQVQHGVDGRKELGPGSISKNLHRDICVQLSVLYDDPPEVNHPTGEAVADFIGRDGYIDRAGLWQQGGHLQRMTLSERECFKRVSWSDTRGGLMFETVGAHNIVAKALPGDPTALGMVQQLMWVDKDDISEPAMADGSAGMWVWERWDIRDPESPEYGIFEYDAQRPGNIGQPVSLRGAATVEGYPWVFGDGRPFLPWELYHAEDPIALFDPYVWTESVIATLDCGCLITQYLHLMFRAAHTKKVSIGLMPLGGTTSTDGHGARSMNLQGGMTSIEVFKDMDNTPGNPGRFHEFKPAASPSEYMTAIQKYITLVANVAGIDAAHIVRESADAWSGAALTVDRDGKRSAQATYGARFAKRDEALLGKAAAICNLNAGTSYPEEGYRIRYKALPLTPAEEMQRREHAAQMVADGRWSDIDAHMYLNPGMERPEAIADIARIAKDRTIIPTPDRGGQAP